MNSHRDVEVGPGWCRVTRGVILSEDDTHRIDLYGPLGNFPWVDPNSVNGALNHLVDFYNLSSFIDVNNPVLLRAGCRKAHNQIVCQFNTGPQLAKFIAVRLHKADARHSDERYRAHRFLVQAKEVGEHQ